MAKKRHRGRERETEEERGILGTTFKTSERERE